MSDSRPRVVYWNNQPTPYVVERFNAVAESGKVRLEAWFDNMRESDRTWDVDPAQWRFPATVLGTTDDDRVRDRVPTALLRERQPDLLIANYDRLHMITGLLAASDLATRTAVRCLPAWPAWNKFSVARSAAKYVLFHSVDAAKVPGPDGAGFARRYGLRSERIWTVRQSIDVEHYASARNLRDERGYELRRRFGAQGCAFLYTGRIWRGKGLDDLVTAFRTVHRRVPNTSLLIAGDGPDEARLRSLTKDMDGIRWLGFVQPADLPEVYAAADVLVFPTLGDPNGLVVEEAMAAGLPVISTSAAGDIRLRLQDGRSGYIVPASDPPALASRMQDLAADSERRGAFGAMAARSASGMTPAAYAADFDAFVFGALAAAPRWSPARSLAPVIRAATARTTVIAERMRRFEPQDA